MISWLNWKEMIMICNRNLWGLASCWNAMHEWGCIFFFCKLCIIITAHTVHECSGFGWWWSHSWSKVSHIRHGRAKLSFQKRCCQSTQKEGATKSCYSLIYFFSHIFFTLHHFMLSASVTFHCHYQPIFISTKALKAKTHHPFFLIYTLPFLHLPHLPNTKIIFSQFFML